MRGLDGIKAMVEQLETNIYDHGWDAGVDGAAAALAWVLGEPHAETARLERLLERPDAERREDWIRRGGDPREWPLPPSR